MFQEVKFRKGTAAEHATYTGEATDLTVDTTFNTIRVHDGVTAGGHRLAKHEDIPVLSALGEALIPSATDSFDLGTPSMRWNDLYLSGTKIGLGVNTIKTEADGSIQFLDSADAPSDITAKGLKLGTGTDSRTIENIAGRLSTTNEAGATVQTVMEDVSIANLVLENVLGTQYGGTGLSTFTTNGVMFASDAATQAFVTGTTGQLLQINASGVPEFNKLDGGTFAGA